MIFKPEDFYFNKKDNCHPSPHTAADIANKLLQEWIDKQPVVYRSGDDDSLSWWPKEFRHDTHRARLVCIEELKQKVCSHEPPKSYHSTERIRCVHCNVELTATWKAEE